MRKRWLAIMSAVCMLALLLAGCGREMASNGGAPGDGYYTGDVATDSDMSVESESTAESTTPRKVIVTLEFTLQVQDFTAASKALEKLVGESDGYIEYAHVSGESQANGEGTYTLRIPVDKVDTFAAAMEQVGTVSSRSRNEEDITDQYYDVQAAIDAKTAQRDRLLELIKKAETLSDMLQLESEFTDVQTELDQLIGQLKRYDSRVTYATVEVYIRQTALTQSGNVDYGSRLWQALTDSFGTALEVLKGIGVAIVWLLPYGLVALALLIVWRCTRKRRQAAKERRQAAKVHQSPIEQDKT